MIPLIDHVHNICNILNLVPIRIIGKDNQYVAYFDDNKIMTSFSDKNRFNYIDVSFNMNTFFMYHGDSPIALKFPTESEIFQQSTADKISFTKEQYHSLINYFSTQCIGITAVLIL